MIAPISESREQPCYRANEGCQNTVYGAGACITCGPCSADIAARLAAREQAWREGRAR